MTFSIIGDIHLGVNRNSHTTPASRVKLKEAIYDQASWLTKSDDTFQLGDLFDQYWCDAETLQQGLAIHSNCELCLVGNHDEKNLANSTSAMKFLKDLEGRTWDDTNQPSVKSLYHQGVTIQYINHKMTQTLFDESIDKVQALGGLLFLHCNVDSGYATDEASLNITGGQLEWLLTRVDLIFIAHEHNPRALYDGKVVVTGCIHPTSFSDISDKYVWSVDKDLKVTRELIWDAKKNSLKFDYKSLFEDIYLDGYQFLEVTGVAERSELPKIARAIANLWKTVPSALMIKNSVTCEKQVVEAQETTKFADSITQVSNELRGSKLQPIWEHYLGRIDETS